MKAAAEPQQPDGPSLGFVGAGMMATAMINGIIASKVGSSTHAGVVRVGFCCCCCCCCCCYWW